MAYYQHHYDAWNKALNPIQPISHLEIPPPANFSPKSVKASANTTKNSTTPSKTSDSQPNNPKNPSLERHQPPPSKKQKKDETPAQKYTVLTLPKSKE